MPREGDPLLAGTASQGSNSSTNWNTMGAIRNLIGGKEQSGRSHPAPQHQDSAEEQLNRINPLRTQQALWKDNYATETKLFLIFLYVALLAYIGTVFFVPLYIHFQEKDEWCGLVKEEETGERYLGSGDSSPSDSKTYRNPDYDDDPCDSLPLAILMGLTLRDCDISRRMTTAVFMGGLVGYERRSTDRPAGVRTMSLVALGACFFTVSSILGFRSSTMGWDASRVTAALPSGVGFLGGALIWKGTVFMEGGEKHQVHGLTTAASLWLSAAIGVGCGGALYIVTIYATVLVLLVLRYGPKMSVQDEEEEENDPREEETERLTPTSGKAGTSGDESRPGAKPSDEGKVYNIPETPVSFEQKYNTERSLSRRRMRDVPTFGS